MPLFKNHCILSCLVSKRFFLSLYSLSFIPFLVILTTCLSSCSGSDQDRGRVSSVETQISGLALDGGVARATVYFDTNNNARRDPWEDHAFTDDDGYYSYNPLTNINYCSEDALTQEKNYCLKSASALGEVIIRVENGYDISTGEPFIGQLSRRVNTDLFDDHTLVNQSLIISPLTSLVSGITDESTQLLFEKLDIDESVLNINYFDSAQDNIQGVDLELLRMALKVHKTVTILADRLSDYYDEVGQALGAPSDASSMIYLELSNELLANDFALSDILSNPDHLNSVVVRAEAQLRSIYQDRDYVLPPLIDMNNEMSDMARGVSVASQIPQVVDNLLTSDVIISPETTNGPIKALEALIIKSVNEGAVDNVIDTVISFLSQSIDTPLLEALLESLNQDNADLSSLITSDFSGDDFDSVEGIESASSFDDSIESFSNLSGQTIVVSDLDLGSENDLKDIEIAFYFDGQQESVGGAFLACVKYIDGATSDGRLGEANTRGELVDGFWSLLGANDNNDQSYNLLMTIHFLGSEYQAIMKPGVNELKANEEGELVDYQTVRFDYDGELRSWYSVNGFVDNSEGMPSSNEDCRLRLPLRVDLGS